LFRKMAGSGFVQLASHDVRLSSPPGHEDLAFEVLGNS